MSIDSKRVCMSRPNDLINSSDRLTSTATSCASPGIELQVIFQQPRARERHSVCGLELMATGDKEGGGSQKTVQYTWRGLRMVGEPSLFDLEEPVWHPDEKVLESQYTA